MDEEEYDAATVNPFGGSNSAAQESRRRREEARRRREAEEETRSRGVVTTQGGGGVTATTTREIDDFSDGQAPTFEEYNQAGKRQGKRKQQIRRDYERALNQYEASLYDNLDEPSVDDLSYEASQEEGDFFMPDSMAGQAMADQGSIDAQRRALGQMEDIYTQGGYTDLEREQIGQAMQQARDLERAGTMAARQQAAARGMTGSGAQMAAQLAAQQGAMNRGRSAATDIAMAGQQRALQALQGAGRTAGEMRGQSFEEGFKRGSAIDDFATSDIDYRRDREERRADRETDARRRRGEAAGESFGYQLDTAKAKVDQSQKGRQIYQGVEAGIDANTNANKAMVGQAIGMGAKAGAAIAGKPF